MTRAPETASAELIRLLGAVPLFRRLDADTLGLIAARAKPRPMRSGETLFRRGDAGSSMLVILAGRVRIALPARDGREQVLRVLQPGEVVGEMALLDGRSRTADATAETNGQLLMVERRDMLEMLRASPDLALAVLTIVSERLRVTNALLESVLFYDAAGRLATTLLMLTEGQPGRRLDITQGALGERIGAARETVNKRLREWQAAGLIAVEPGRITVRDVAGLRKLAPATELLDGDLPAIW